MRVFQPTYKDRKGKRQKTDNWHISFQDHCNVWRRVVGFTDRSATESLGRKLATLAARRAVSEPLTPELAEWLDGITDELRAKLTKWCIIDSRATMATLPLLDHVGDWHDALIDSAKTSAHAALLKARVVRMVKDCKFIRYADMNESVVAAFLAKLRNDRKVSYRTSNFYMKAAQQFCRWMVRNERALKLPLAAMEPLDAELDRKLVRRALAVEELGRLIKAAERGDEWEGISGKERALIYRLATETGLRRNEVRSLTASSFDLNDEAPTVTVKATYSKRRKQDLLPLRADMAAQLRVHLATKHPSAKAFALGKYAAKMIQHDIAAAKIAHVTDDGVVDFHSLRVTFITNLARGGIHPKVAQTLARHSTMELTMRTYTKLNTGEQRAGLDALPTFAQAAAG